jgi:hypothetical protein
MTISTPEQPKDRRFHLRAMAAFVKKIDPKSKGILLYSLYLVLYLVE